MLKAYVAALGFLFGLTPVQAQTATTLTTTPAAMTFQYVLNAASLPAAQTLQVASVPVGARFTLAVTGSPSNGAWLLLSTASGTAPVQLKVQVNPTGLSAGSYPAVITISGPGGAVKTVAVTLVVSRPASTLLASPVSLSFSYTVGNPIPAPGLTNPFVLSSNGTPLGATITVANAPWLTISPTGSVSLAGLFDTITVTVD